ncbi:MAG: hypothetical protein ACYS4W_09040 [Planctomycetota bacterium]
MVRDELSDVNRAHAKSADESEQQMVRFVLFEQDLPCQCWS